MLPKVRYSMIAVMLLSTAALGIIGYNAMQPPPVVAAPVPIKKQRPQWVFPRHEEPPPQLETPKEEELKPAELHLVRIISPKSGGGFNVRTCKPTGPNSFWECETKTE